MTTRKIASATVVALLLAACSNDMGTKETWGTMLGGLGGAIIGAQFGQGKGQLVGVALGAAAGAYVGHQIGTSLDSADRQARSSATQHALEREPIGTTSTWANPDSGHSGTITPVRGYQMADGQDCREYRQTVMIGDEEEEAVGKACRQPDGSWRTTH